MHINCKTFLQKASAGILLFGSSLAGFTQQPPQPPPAQRFPYSVYGASDDLRLATGGHYPFSSADSWYAGGQPINVLAEQMRLAQQRSEAQRNHDEYLERVRIRSIQMEAGMPISVMENPYRARSREEAQYERDQRRAQQAHAEPNAPDQSELLKSSKDRDFILRNFRTMYVDSSEAKFFSDDDMKAAFGRNKEFEKLKIRIVDDPRVADAVFKISYTFAWDYPFELRHQNTTIVLLSGKGEGPMYGPLGAVDVARQFVKAAKPWREEKKPESKKDGESK